LETGLMNKRRALRVDYRTKSRCKFLSADGVRLDLLSKYDFGIQIINLSTGGACISCEGSVRVLVAKVGSIIELEIPVKNKNLIVNGKVVWWEKTNGEVNAGLCFDFQTKQEDRELLHKHLHKKLSLV